MWGGWHTLEKPGRDSNSTVAVPPPVPGAYIQPFTGRCLTRAAFTFGTRLAAFRAACEKLGAEPLPHGDAGYVFPFFGPFAMAVLVWAGDEEFPPSAQLLYTGNFAQGFAPEDRVVAGDILISHIKSAM